MRSTFASIAHRKAAVAPNGEEAPRQGVTELMKAELLRQKSSAAGTLFRTGVLAYEDIPRVDYTVAVRVPPSAVLLQDALPLVRLGPAAFLRPVRLFGRCGNVGPREPCGARANQQNFHQIEAAGRSNAQGSASSPPISSGASRPSMAGCPLMTLVK